MVINAKSNGISYDAMIKSKNLNAFFDTGVAEEVIDKEEEEE